MVMSDAEWVRAFSTSDTEALSHVMILDFLQEHADESAQDRRKLALADALEYLARDDVYESYSRGGISVGRNRLYERAQALRAEVGMVVETGTLSHQGYADEDGTYQ